MESRQVFGKIAVCLALFIGFEAAASLHPKEATRKAIATSRPPKTTAVLIDESLLQQSAALHTSELLGRRKNKTSEAADSMKRSEMIDQILQDSLPKKDRSWSKVIANEILVQSQKHQLDPLFVVAMIATESSFNRKAKGSVGEIGLMQVRPETALEVVRREKWPSKWARNLENPAHNIRIGMTYLAHLRTRFPGQPNFYISAYNMGARKVRLLTQSDRTPSEYTKRVMKNYLGFLSELDERNQGDTVVSSNN